MTSSHEPAGATKETKVSSSLDEEPGTAPNESSPPAVDSHIASSELKHHSTPDASPTTLRVFSHSSRPQLLARPTTALSLTGASTYAQADGTSPKSSPASRVASRKPSVSQFSPHVSNVESSETASVRSVTHTLETAVDKLSLFGHESSQAWQSLAIQVDHDPLFPPSDSSEISPESHILEEFRNASDDQDSDEQTALQRWTNKLKHFFILSASGKPIYSRHGNDQIISHYIGVIQTIVSSYQSSNDPLKVFSAGGTNFVILIKGPLTLVAISKLYESPRQLQTQLESLYMQILSTLTLPVLEKMFLSRASTDLRRPLQGTDVLLDGLTDGFTRGSPSTLLSALECLRMRKTHRRVVNDTLLKVRSHHLVYGLIAAAGRLVSVVRPKKHSLHPGDLHLIFNMLFEAGSVKAGGGENWIPLCLPGFNNTGYVYMYVSFVAASEPTASNVSTSERPSSAGKDDELAIILISANKESFFELRKMRDDLVRQLSSNGSMAVLQTAIARGRNSCSSMVPGTVLHHFLYKSRGNVQFVMPSFSPEFTDLVARRKLMSVYDRLHEAVHSRTSHLRVQHVSSNEVNGLAWETPLFELYCVAGPHSSRAAICHGANKVVQWVRREEERVFIIGGAVF